MKPTVPQILLVFFIALLSGMVMNGISMHEPTAEWVMESLIAGVIVNILMLSFVRSNMRRSRIHKYHLTTPRVVRGRDAGVRTQQNRA